MKGLTSAWIGGRRRFPRDSRHDDSVAAWTSSSPRTTAPPSIGANPYAYHRSPMKHGDRLHWFVAAPHFLSPATAMADTGNDPLSLKVLGASEGELGVPGRYLYARDSQPHLWQCWQVGCSRDPAGMAWVWQGDPTVSDSAWTVLTFTQAPHASDGTRKTRIGRVEEEVNWVDRIGVTRPNSISFLFLCLSFSKFKLSIPI